MNKLYFIIINNQQVGPFSKEELASKNITPEMLVWRQGMTDWKKAAEIPELADILSSNYGYPNFGNNNDSRWFAMIDGVQRGPDTVANLIAMGLTPKTPVWKNGMPDWTEASNIPEIMSQFMHTQAPPNQGYNTGYNPNTGYNGNNGYNSYNNYNAYNNPGYNNVNPNPNSMPPFNWMPWAIAATIVGFLFSCIGAIFGIIAIINANKANTFFAQGHDIFGNQANNTAKIMTIIAFVLAVIGMIGTGFIYKADLFG
ncbi:MAG: DUF4339 domain-containing protein [Muribaculaceae bacterium]|nr:DUF4339 domain-containing protein [Muribaculaceae bacterium]